MDIAILFFPKSLREGADSTLAGSFIGPVLRDIYLKIKRILKYSIGCGLLVLVGGTALLWHLWPQAAAERTGTGPASFTDKFKKLWQVGV